MRQVLSVRFPISIFERNGDVLTYMSLREAEAALEPTDVENNEYTAQDADGRPLAIAVVAGEVPVLWGLWKVRSKAVVITEPSSERHPGQ